MQHGDVRIAAHLVEGHGAIRPQAGGDGSVWEEAIENTRRLLEESKKQIDLLRKQSHVHVQKVAIEHSDLATSRVVAPMPSNYAPAVASAANAVPRGESVGESTSMGFGERGGPVSTSALSESWMAGSAEVHRRVPAVASSPAVVSSRESLPSQRSMAAASGNRQEAPPPPPSPAQKGGGRKAKGSPAGGTTPRESQKRGATTPRQSKGGTGTDSHRKSGTSPKRPEMLGRSTTQSTKRSARGSYMDGTKSSDQKHTAKVWGEMLQKGTGIGGGSAVDTSKDGLRSEDSTRSKDFSSGVTHVPASSSKPSSTPAQRNQAPSFGSSSTAATREAPQAFDACSTGGGSIIRGGASLTVADAGGCSVASGGDASAGGGASVSLLSGGGGGHGGGGAGSVSAMSSCSGGAPMDVACLTGVTVSGFGGSFSAPCGNVRWRQHPDSALPALISYSQDVSFSREAAPAVLPPFDTLSAPPCLDEQDRSESASQLADLFDAFSSKSEGFGAVRSAFPSNGEFQPEDMLDKVHQIMKDHRIDQRRLQEVEAKLSKIKQENVSLVMENFKLRAKAPRTSSGTTVSGRTASCHAPVGPTAREVSAPTIRTIASAVRPGAQSVQSMRPHPRPSNLATLVARSRSESPGPRSAWATSVLPAAGCIGPFSASFAVAQVPASPAIDPRMVAIPAPLRQTTPQTVDREYGSAPLLSTVSATSSQPAIASKPSVMTTMTGPTRAIGRPAATCTSAVSTPAADPSTPRMQVLTQGDPSVPMVPVAWIRTSPTALPSEAAPILVRGWPPPSSPTFGASGVLPQG